MQAIVLPRSGVLLRHHDPPQRRTYQPTEETVIRYVNYPKVIASCGKALKALSCEIRVGGQSWDEATTAYAMLTTIDAAALQRRIEVTGGVAEDDKARIVKQVYGTIHTEHPTALDVLFAERLGEMLAILQAVKEAEPTGKYEILHDHIAAATALTGATLAAVEGGPEYRAAAIGMLQKAAVFSDKANAGLRDFLTN
jgi:hypothetical protein